MPTTMGSIRYPIGELTPNVAMELDYTLCVYCDGCRVLKLFDMLRLVVAGRGDQALAWMTFRCGKCGKIGKPHVSGWIQGERASWD